LRGICEVFAGGICGTHTLSALSPESVCPRGTTAESVCPRGTLRGTTRGTTRGTINDT